LKTEVKSALADDGVAENSPIVVDSDHGKILLKAVMKTAEEAKRGGNIDANAPGVVAVRNKLTRKSHLRDLGSTIRLLRFDRNAVRRSSIQLWLDAF